MPIIDRGEQGVRMNGMRRMGAQRIARCAATVGLVVAAAAGTVPAAAAPTAVAASGAGCTIVGTGGADVLEGTAGRDVICGLGGDDVLRGLGGADVLDGGTGRDRLVGGYGNDALYGGYGADRLLGGYGTDTLAGQAGNDTLAADAGSDTLSGGAGDDTVAGGAGKDSVSGGTGRDVVGGGDGDDVLLGGDGPDRLYGGAGDDDLDGQAGQDVLDGGRGTDWCTVRAEDTRKACVYDRAAPTVVALDIEPGTVDVTASARIVRARIHLRDDTGVQALTIDGTQGVGSGWMTQPASGSVRDGWWETTLEVPRYLAPGQVQLWVWTRDRVGRTTQRFFDDALTVVNTSADTTHPVVSDLEIAPDAVDVRAEEATVTVTARITDDLAGVWYADVELWSPDAYGNYNSAPVHGMLDRVDGTALDGWYRGTLTIPAGSGGGVWSACARVSDATRAPAHNYCGDKAYAWREAQNGGLSGSPYESHVPGGSLTVTGDVPDSTRPELVEVRVSGTTVDTLPGAASVALDLHATDVGDGVFYVQADVTGETGEINAVGTLVSGTGTDGWWRIVVTFPQGTPPGRYEVTRLYVRDPRHVHVYATPGTSGNWGHTVLPAEQFTTADGGLWDGFVTVVENPG